MAILDEEMTNQYTDEEKQIIERWILNEIDERVPGDEGNSDALVYNLVHLCREGQNYRHYNYEPDQDDEINKWDLDNRVIYNEEEAS